MSEFAIPWTALRLSGRARGVAAGGLALSAASVAAAGAAALIAPSLLRGAAAVLCLAILIGAIIWWRRPAPVVELSVTPAADILLRAHPGAEPLAVGGLFVAPWLIVVGDRTVAIPVWPDSLNAVHFRRLAVATRWRRPSAEA